MKKRLVIYHGHCLDGFTAAWAARQSPPWRDAEFFAASYQEPPPDVSDLFVLVVDFSYPRDVMLAMARSAKSLVILDHHRTAKDDLMPLMKELESICVVPLSNGAVAYVDREDLSLVSSYSWSAATHGGAVAYAGGGRENATQISMHRLIIGGQKGVLIDHVNRNTLDNRRSNLRPATKQQNAANMNRGSLFKGVRVSRDKWCAQITVGGENKYLGTFDTPEDAALAYDAAARTVFGQYARCNFGETYEPVPPTLKIEFDMNRSGAGITWDVLHPGKERPWLVSYVEDRDIWRWALPQSKEVNAWVGACRRDSFDDWDRLSATPLPKVVEKGEAVLAYIDRYVSEMAEQARTVEVAGTKVPMVNAPYICISELVGKLAESAPFAVGWFQRSDGLYAYSLRSRGPEGVDVSEIAKRYGGGGHRNSAGFTLPERLPEA